MKKMKCQFAIKYEIIGLDDTHYFFKPRKLLKGEETENGFKSENGKEYPVFINKIDGRRKYYVDMIYADDELSYMFDYDGDDEDFIGEYFFENYKDTIMYVDMEDMNDADIPYRNMINTRLIKDSEPSSIYYMDNAIPNVVLNDKAIRELLDCKKLKEVKLLITKYQKNLETIKKRKETDGVTRISITGNKVNYYETDRNIDFEDLEKAVESKKDISSNSGTVGSKEISYVGLRNYIRERIFGHENEVDTFAQKLYMNHTAIDGEQVESILFVGPTGTGKTETVRAACKYLGIPMNEVNASNLIAQGIVGISIEDVILGLYERAGGDLKKAQRGLIFLDEFDKLHDTTNETKNDVKNILLTFTAGGNFPISTSLHNFIFDSTMTNKIYAGVFERISEKQNPMGFGTTTAKYVPMLGTPNEIRQKIVEKKYMTQEELSRITTVLAYNDLSRETKKDILLNAKSSIYLMKKERYKRQFKIDLDIDNEFIDTLLDKQPRSSTGMRNINNSLSEMIDTVEKIILENEYAGYKKLILTKETVEDHKKFELSK